MHVRPAEPNDFDFLWSLDWSPLVKERDTFYLLALSMQSRWAYIAEVASRQAGVLLASEDDSHSRLYINHLLVLSSHRKAGVGRCLMARVEEDARSAGIGRIWLMTGEAEDFYKRLGYRISTKELPAPLRRHAAHVKKVNIMVKLMQHGRMTPPSIAAGVCRR